MKLRSICGLLVLVLLVGGSAAWPAVEPVEYVDVSPSVVMADNPNGSNLVCIALDDGLVFVDTGLVTEIAAEFRDAMEQRFDRPATRLVLTHGHIDHLFAMAAFEDIEVVAPSADRPLIEAMVATEWDEERIATYSGIFPSFADAIGTAAPFLPTVWVDGERDLGSGGTELHFATTGGHTIGSSYLWFPSERVIVTGDLVQVDKYPYFGDRTNDLDAWISALKRWHALDPSHVCPGHGRVVGKDYLQLEWQYFEQLTDALRTLKAEGVPLEEAVAHPSLPAGYWPEDQPEPRWWRYCIALHYRSL